MHCTQKSNHGHTHSTLLDICILMVHFCHFFCMVQVQLMAKKYRVYVSKADETEDGDYLVDHSIVIYFHDDTGDLADCFTQSMRPSAVVEKIVERMTFVPSF